MQLLVPMLPHLPSTGGELRRWAFCVSGNPLTVIVVAILCPSSESLLGLGPVPTRAAVLFTRSFGENLRLSDLLKVTQDVHFAGTMC